jgi:protein-disulfide isomerase
MPFADRRALPILAAALTALALGAAPALAGDDDDGDDDSPGVVQQVAPSPATSPVVAATPQGGVATGLGGTALLRHGAS